MKKIIELPLKGSVAFLLDNADMRKLGFGFWHNKDNMVALCDTCGAQIDKGSYIYVPVMNHILCQKCFEDWQKNGTWYPEDNNYQNRYALSIANTMGYKSLDDIPTIEYDHVDTDSDDVYANLSDKELKEVYDDMVADDEISRQKEL